MSINASSVCAQSLCGLGTCNTGFANCDQESTTGCEIDTRSDVNNCAGCGNVCQLPHASSRCEASTCEVEGCDAGYGNCDLLSPNGCESELAADAMNCGACGKTCWSGQYCAAATCRARELIIFGGQLSFTMGNTTNDVFKFDLVSNSFTQLNPATPDGPILGRAGHVATFDFPRNRMVVWGGIDGAGTLSTTDTWALDFTVTPPAWRKVTTSGTPPSARFGMAAAQDVSNAKWYLFGGSTDLGTGLSELFTFDLATNTWAQVHGRNSTGGPMDRTNAVAAFDPSARKFVLFGGNNMASMDLRELWAFDVTARTWEQLPMSGPIARNKGAFFDGSPVHLFSGIASLLTPPASMVTDFWSLDVSAATPWMQLSSTVPNARFSAASIARDGKLYVFAGGSTVGTTQTVFTDLWVADLSVSSTWTRLSEGLTNAPSGKLNASMVGR
jgi:N-acetylneuraminic acid mutarotase